MARKGGSGREDGRKLNGRARGCTSPRGYARPGNAGNSAGRGGRKPGTDAPGITYPWGEMEAEYETTMRSLDSIARQYQCPLPTVKIKAARGGWFDKRKAFQAEIHARVMGRSLEDRVREVLALRASASEAATDGLAIISGVTARLRELGIVNPKDVREAMQAAGEALDLALRSMGLASTKVDGEESAPAPIRIAWDPTQSPEALIETAARLVGADPAPLLEMLARSKAAK